MFFLKKRVKVDPSIKDLVPEYLERKSREVQEALDLLLKEDFEAIQYLGHGMAGTGTSYGFPEISLFGKKIECENSP